MRDFKAFVRSHVAPLALPPGLEQKIVDEWSAQLEDVYEALRAGGLPEDQAWREIQRQIPDRRELLREPLRPSHRSGVTTARGIIPAVAAIREKLAAGLGRDIRSSARLLVKEPGFSAAVVLTLAVCLGANAAIFTVVNRVVLAPLQLPDADRIVGMGDI